MRYLRLLAVGCIVLVAGCTANERNFTYPPQSGVETASGQVGNSMQATGNEFNLHERQTPRTGTGGQTGM